MSGGATQVKLRVSPGARRPGIAGRHGAAWKIRVAEPPEDGRANDAVLRLLSETLDLPVKSVELVAGHTSRDKVVALTGISPDGAERLLARAAGKGRQ
jgi:uncharacterized protein (TIGR00251 family)